MPLRALLASALCALLLTAPRNASACTCASSPDVRGYLDTSDVAFEGTLVEATPAVGVLIDRFRVHRAWKGSVTEEMIVDVDSASCGMASSCAIFLDVGERYLVFASRGPYCQPRVDLCSGTRLVADAGLALDQLGDAGALVDAGVAPAPGCIEPAACTDTGSGGAPFVTPDASAGTGGAGGSTGGGYGDASDAKDAAVTPPGRASDANDASGCTLYGRHASGDARGALAALALLLVGAASRARPRCRGNRRG